MIPKVIERVTLPTATGSRAALTATGTGTFPLAGFARGLRLTTALSGIGFSGPAQTQDDGTERADDDSTEIHD